MVKRIGPGALFALASALAAPVHAALGDRVAPAATQSVHEATAATGTTVREYASPDGVVYAVTWEGPFLPDLKALLGPYYDRYVDAARVHRRGRGPLVVSVPGLVLVSAGHPRGFHGRAYVPELVPAGVQAESLR